MTWRGVYGRAVQRGLEGWLGAPLLDDAAEIPVLFTKGADQVGCCYFKPVLKAPGFCA
jgi:hypothetical protein